MSFLGIRQFFFSPAVVKGELQVLTLNILGNLFCSFYNKWKQSCQNSNLPVT